MKSKIIWLIITAFFLMFCSSIRQAQYNYHVKRNRDFNNKLAISLLNKNNNVFYKISTYSTHSVIWTYDKDIITVYTLINGKITNRQIYIGAIQFSDIPTYQQIRNDVLANCPFVADGDILGITVNVDGKSEIKTLPISFNCFKQNQYENDFLNSIVDDINKYGIY